MKFLTLLSMAALALAAPAPAPAPAPGFSILPRIPPKPWYDVEKVTTNGSFCSYTGSHDDRYFVLQIESPWSAHALKDDPSQKGFCGGLQDWKNNRVGCSDFRGVDKNFKGCADAGYRMEGDKKIYITHWWFETYSTCGYRTPTWMVNQATGFTTQWNWYDPEGSIPLSCFKRTIKQNQKTTRWNMLNEAMWVGNEPPEDDDPRYLPGNEWTHPS